MTVSSYQERQQEIVNQMALKAYHQPLLDSKLWFHGDIRDNFYYASYLLAASVDPNSTLPLDRELAKDTATAVLLELLSLQDQDPQSATYGHFPLNLNPIPREAKPHSLPVELMGSLIIYFHKTYVDAFSQPLRTAFESAALHIYRGSFYRKPLEHYGHHEAKYTATKLILGQLFDDKELLEDGHRSLRDTLARIQSKGMIEYGSQPWLWHWIQAFTCAWELAEHSAIKHDLHHMLNYLWRERALFYLQGTWVGAHCRGLSHDIPRDSYVAHDYVQFGNFPLPKELPRVEYAGFLFYEAPESIRSMALDRTKPTEVKKSIPSREQAQDTRLHSYAYITESFAAGGMWERVTEFDNEQQRWDITLPLTGQAGINQAFFFHPGNMHSANDPRHQSEYAEVLFHKNVIMALYPIPEACSQQIIGVLPLGTWVKEPHALFGRANEVYFAIYLMQAYSVEEQQDRYVVTSEGSPNGVVVEVLSLADAAGLGILSVEQWTTAMKGMSPIFSHKEGLQVSYRNSSLELLELGVDPVHGRMARLNSASIDFSEYKL
jgi:hypothetical protein